jgi:molybdenum cofactor sulfurtransferase
MTTISTNDFIKQDHQDFLADYPGYGATAILDDLRRDEYSRLEQQASAKHISLRTGTFCNPGGGEMALSLDKTDLILCGEPSPRLTMDDIRLAIDWKSLGAVRISVGLVRNFEDVYQLVVFANRLCRGESAE